MSTKILAPRAGRLSVTTIEKLRFADTDRQGHITNTVFAVCCQNARMELLCDPKRVPIPRIPSSSSPSSCSSSGRRCIGPARSRSARAWSGSGAPRSRSHRPCSWMSAASPPPSPVVALMDMMTRRSTLASRHRKCAARDGPGELRPGFHPGGHGRCLAPIRMEGQMARSKSSRTPRHATGPRNAPSMPMTHQAHVKSVLTQ